MKRYMVKVSSRNFGEHPYLIVHDGDSTDKLQLSLESGNCKQRFKLVVVGGEQYGMFMLRK